MLWINKLKSEFPIGGRLCSSVSNGVDGLYFYFDRKESAKFIFIMFPGAYDRSKGITQFQRFSWSRDLPGHVLIFDDPTINEFNDLSIGWFQGGEGRNTLTFCKEVIREIVSFLNIDFSKVIFFGSSAGGFTSLKMTETFQDSFAVVINPQTDILRYSKTHVSKLLKYSYGATNIDEMNDGCIENTRYIPSFDGKGKVFYFQNIFDQVHINNHCKPIIRLVNKGDCILESSAEAAIDECKKFNFLYYSDEIKGHSPPSKDRTLKFIDVAFRSASVGLVG